MLGFGKIPLPALEQQWRDAAAHSDEDTAADLGNDMMRLTAVHDHLEREAVKAFGPTVTRFQTIAPATVPNGDARDRAKPHQRATKRDGFFSPWPLFFPQAPGNFRLCPCLFLCPERSSFGTVLLCELCQIGPQFVPDAAKNSHALFIRSLRHGRRIIETVMQPLDRAEEHRAAFFGVVADGDNVIEPLPLKFIDML